MFAKKLKLERECTTGMLRTKGLGATKWRHGCLRLAQLWNPLYHGQILPNPPTGRRQNIFLSSTFYTCKNAFHQSSRHWLPETVRELLTLLKPLAFSPAFLYPEIFSCFLKPAKIFVIFLKIFPFWTFLQTSCFSVVWYIKYLCWTSLICMIWSQFDV